MVRFEHGALLLSRRRLFFEPVQFDLQLSDLPVEPVLQLLLTLAILLGTF